MTAAQQHTSEGTEHLSVRVEVPVVSRVGSVDAEPAKEFHKEEARNSEQVKRRHEREHDSKRNDSG
ncbi:MAG TPA: hypothetical protein VHX14_19755 [Thermoanaerobaculia bacterium]|nr:hypothetical protein [Thermoanaerobaculia bacterium]